MNVFLKHSIADFFYCLDLNAQQVEMCSTVGGRERIERYGGVSGTLQENNVIITEREYYKARSYTLQRLGAIDTTPPKEELSGSPIDIVSRIRSKSNFPLQSSNN